MSDDTVELKNESGSKVKVHLHGATIISWIDRGEEVLFVSKDAIFNNKKAIRGGIPLVFQHANAVANGNAMETANFGPWTFGPQHGFARIKRWTLETPGKNKDGVVTASFSLVDDEETRAMWNYKFKLLYTVCLGKDYLKLTLAVSNTGKESFDFTTLMHTYFTVDIGKTIITGLKGLHFKDKVQVGDNTEERDQIKIDQEYDRIYQDVPGEVRVLQENQGKHSSVTITTEGLPDIVVWNPWAEKAKAMADFGDEDYKSMVCVEAGAVSRPCSVGPGASLTFSQKIAVTQTKSSV